MAVITTSTFDPIKDYVRVRLGQGVPIVDADVNEREDIAMFELRAFLKWFVGDGVPHGNDGFRIAEAPAKANNFLISAGIGAAAADPLASMGRCLVNGIDVMIHADVAFVDQKLHVSQGAAAANLSLRLGTPVIAAMTVPAAAGTVHLWLDVWDVLWTANDDALLLLPGLGVESCARMKRFWAVRARDSAVAPVLGDLDFAPGHVYYRIATIARRLGESNVNATDITDLREQRLLVPPSTIIPDLFNTSVLDYRRGLGRPQISFRQAINALIRGQVPAMPETEISVLPPLPARSNTLGRGIFFQGNSAICIWASDRSGQSQVFVAQLDVGAPEPGAAAAGVAVTSIPNSHAFPHAAPLLNGQVVVAYEEVIGANRDIKLKCDVVGNLAGAAPANIASAPTNERKPFVLPVGALGAEQAIVMWYDSATKTWQSNRFDVATQVVSPKLAISATATNDTDLHAAKDAADNVWAAFMASVTIPNPLSTIRVVPVPATVADPEFTLGTSAVTTVNKNPFVLVDASGAPWVFWVSTDAGVSSIKYARRTGPAAWTSTATIPGMPPGNYVDNGPTAVIDADGAIWVFWDSFLFPNGNKDIWYARLDPVSGVWSGMKPTTGTGEQDQDAVTITRGDGAIWLFWNRVHTGANNLSLLFRRLITTV